MTISVIGLQHKRKAIPSARTDRTRQRDLTTKRESLSKILMHPN